MALPELVAEDGDGLRILAVDGVGRNEAASRARENAMKLKLLEVM